MIEVFLSHVKQISTGFAQILYGKVVWAAKFIFSIHFAQVGETTRGIQYSLLYMLHLKTLNFSHIVVTTLRALW